MKKFSKILILLLALSLLVSIPAVTAFAADGDETELKVSFAPVYGGAKAIATLTFDDSVYPTALLVQQMCEKYGMEATMMMWVARIGQSGSNYADAKTWAALFAKGQLEPQSHSYSHADLRSTTENGLANQSEEIFEREIITSKTNLEEMFPEYDFISFAPSFGGLSAEASTIARQNYYSIRGVSKKEIQSIDPGTSGGSGSWANLYSPTVVLDGATEQEQIAYLKGIIDSYVEAGGWYTPFIHRVGDDSGSEMSTAVTDAYFAYLDTYQESGELWVTKHSSAVKYIRERQNSTPKAYAKDGKIYVSSTMETETADGLPLSPEVFNHPLTVRVTLPADCASVTYTFAGEERTATARKNSMGCYAYIDVAPDGTETVVSTVAGDPVVDPVDPLVLETEYGKFTIPEEYADAQEYPWVAFKADGTFLDAADNLTNENYGVLRHQLHQTAGEVHYIFLRDHATEEKYFNDKEGVEKNVTDYYNLCFTKSEIIIDLLGNTLRTKTSGQAFLYLQAKSQGTHSKVTFKNGAIVAANAKPLIISTASSSKTGHVFEFSFEDIRFSIESSSSAPSYWITAAVADKNNTTTSGFLPYAKELNFTDCTFDVTNLPASSYIFSIGDRLGILEDTVNIYGGDFYGDLSSVRFYRLRDLYESQFNILKDEKGDYPTNTRPDESAAPAKILNTADGIMSFTAKGETKNGYTTYSLAPETSEYATPYGFISEAYRSVEDYPMVVFDLTTQTVVHGSKLFHTKYGTGENDDKEYSSLEYITGQNVNDRNYAIFFRADVGTEGFSGTIYNLCNSNNSVIIMDMNGKTLTAKRNIFRLQLKSNAATQQFLIKNGTIDTNGSNLIEYGSVFTSKGVEISNALISFRFDSVNIKMKGGNVLLKQDSSFKDYVNTLNVTFNECDINLASDYAGAFLKVNLFENFMANVTFRGGSINHQKATFPKLVNHNGKDNYTLSFERGIDGRYTKYTTPKNTTAAYDTLIPTPEGDLNYALNATKNDVSTYRLGIKTAYGYIDDAHFDEKQYPVVMFTEGDPTKTWYPSGFGGESGDTIVNQFFRGYNAKNQCGLYNGLDSVLLLRKDYTASGTNYWAGNLSCRFTIDLNGYTLTLNTNLFYMQARTASQADIAVKNGTIVSGSGYVITYGTTTADKKHTNITFDSVIFNNLSKSIFYDAQFINTENANYPDRDKYVTSMDVTFNNCTFNVKSGMSAKIFNFGKDERGTVNLHINGGTFNLADKNYNVFTTGWNGRTIDFGTFDGEYAKVNIASGADMNEKAELNSEGLPMQYRLVVDDNTTATYTLYPISIISAYLNITNDLNLVYRVFLPLGYENPTATFTVGEHTLEVKDYVKDENGLYLFKLTALGPHRMADTVTATVTASYNGKSGTVTNNTLSVKSYADMVRAQNADNAELIALLDALLVYGANAQVYMGHSTDSLVAELGELAEIPEGTIEKNGTTNTDYSIVSAGLRLGGAFDFGVQIKVADLTGLTLKITKGGVEKTVTLTEDMKVGEYYVVYYNGLIASELDESVTFTLVQNGEQIGKSLTLTANAYLAALQTSENTALASLTKALYAYGVAANIYEEVGEDPNYVPKAEIVNKGGAEGTVSYVIDDDDKATATFANSLLAKYSNLTLTYAVRTKSIATLLTEEGPDGLLHYRQANDGSYLYTLNEANVAFWREITASDRVELVNHTHTHAYWGANDDGGEFEYLKTSGDTVYTSTQPVGSSSKELYAAWQILKDVFGDLDPKNTLTFIDAGIGVLTGDKEIDGKTIVGYKKYFNQLLSDAMEADKLITVRSTFTTTTPEGSTSKVVTKDNLVTDAQRMKVPAYMILNANAGDNIENWTAYIDHALAKNGWAPFCIHLIRESEVNTHHILQSQADQLFAYTAELGDRVWVATYTDASLYFCEWASAEVSCEYADGAVTVTLTDEENNEVFDMPLTVKVSVPRSFRSGAVANGKFLTVHKNEDGTQYVLVDVVPDSGAVTIRAK